MNEKNGFAVWITGMPASGKSSITRELVRTLKESSVPIVVLESDVMRLILTPEATYAPEERDRFYHTLASLGEMITRNGVNVIVDATANLRSYREHARSLIPKFVEVFVQCPLDVCKRRDPKGIYRMAAEGKAATVPGMQAAYEPPLRPDITLDCLKSPETGSIAIIGTLKQLRYI
jgi:adenylylsulfate kinase